MNVHIRPTITPQAEEALEDLAESLEISDHRYEQAERRYKSLGEWLNRPESAWPPRDRWSTSPITAISAKSRRPSSRRRSSTTFSRAHASEPLAGLPSSPSTLFLIAPENEGVRIAPKHSPRPSPEATARL
jgi:hypothetical protein